MGYCSVEDLGGVSLDGRYFFDTNVLIYLYGPFLDVRDPKYKFYVSVQDNILKNRGEIFVSPTVISEFVNTYLRLVFSLYNSTNNSALKFKDYRNTNDYIDNAQEVDGQINEILMISSLLCDIVSIDNIVKFCDRIHSNKSDMNDEMISFMCQKNGLVLITHDKDFIGCGVDILSNNKIYK
ncbi:hypothetical protein AUP42_04015 [Thalassospira lucentensis]|uniref:PIN domain-containing protein n=1 Tax=Thalassospira lucentensis TaxID=168935 RepID=A0A154L2R6_9PROT|nr:type II toxin-antitoxin system VapC family toxin [Thalassospira lucentensis]KZB62131.1 hypothetical protein AUP42_04015 [Thalassospira lucentensis]